jgi:hypothetical protein
MVGNGVNKIICQTSTDSLEEGALPPDVRRGLPRRQQLDHSRAMLPVWAEPFQFYWP